MPDIKYNELIEEIKKEILFENRVQEINNNRNRIKRKCSSNSSPSQILIDLPNFFLEDIKKIIEEIYTLSQRKKLSPSLLIKVIKDITNCFLPIYKNYIQNSNFGGFFTSPDINIINQCVENFSKNIEIVVNTQCELIKYKYKEFLRNKKYTCRTFYSVWISIIVAVILGSINIYQNYLNNNHFIENKNEAKIF